VRSGFDVEGRHEVRMRSVRGRSPVIDAVGLNFNVSAGVRPASPMTGGLILLKRFSGVRLLTNPRAIHKRLSSATTRNKGVVQ
jgi:hypothetical protein